MSDILSTKECLIFHLKENQLIFLQLFFIDSIYKTSANFWWGLNSEHLKMTEDQV